MYKDFYGLTEKPFNLTPSPRFLYLSEGHKEALALLKYGIMERKGFILLTGEVGTGKTTIVQALLDSLDANTPCVCISNPLMSPDDFLKYLAYSAFKEKVHFKSKADFLFEFERLLRQYMQDQKPFLLIVDEAQNLSFELLEEIRLLSNLEYADEKLINIFLVGQPELNEKLCAPECRALLQRITHSYNIPPLTEKGTRGYLATRLKIAGARNEPDIFSDGAVGALHRLSGGYPRKINTLADNALLIGYSRGKRKIAAGMIEESYTDSRLETPDRKVDARKVEASPKPAKANAVTRGFWKWAVVLALFLLFLFAGFTSRGRAFFSQVIGYLPVGQVSSLEKQQGHTKVRKKIPVDRADRIVDEGPR